MKFCVFGINRNKKVYKFFAKSNLSYNIYDFFISYKIYQNCLAEKKFKNLFFLVDFGDEKDCPFLFKAIGYDEYTFFPMPWVLIARHSEENPDNNQGIPTKITLKLKGFKENFTDPIEAMKRYDYFIKNHLKCSLYVSIDGWEDVFVSNTQNDIIKNRKLLEQIYCKRYKIKG